EPEAVHAQLGEVVHLLGDAPQRTAHRRAQVARLEPVAPLAGEEAIHEDVVNHRLPRPAGRGQPVDVVVEKLPDARVAHRAHLQGWSATEEGAGGKLLRGLDGRPVGKDFLTALSPRADAVADGCALWLAGQHACPARHVSPAHRVPLGVDALMLHRLTASSLPSCAFRPYSVGTAVDTPLLEE